MALVATLDQEYKVPWIPRTYYKINKTLPNNGKPYTRRLHCCVRACVCVCVCAQWRACTHTQLCPTLCESICPWNFPYKNTGVGFHAKFYHTFKKELTSVFLRHVQKTEAEETLPNLFWKISITLIAGTKTLQKKKITRQYHW